MFFSGFGASLRTNRVRHFGAAAGELICQLSSKVITSLVDESLCWSAQGCRPLIKPDKEYAG